MAIDEVVVGHRQVTRFGHFAEHASGKHNGAMAQEVEKTQLSAVYRPPKWHAQSGLFACCVIGALVWRPAAPFPIVAELRELFKTVDLGDVAHHNGHSS